MTLCLVAERSGEQISSQVQMLPNEGVGEKGLEYVETCERLRQCPKITDSAQENGYTAQALKMPSSAKNSAGTIGT